MTTGTARFDAEKVKSLRIDAERKLPSRGGIGSIFLGLGLMLGIGGSLAFMAFFGPPARSLQVARGAAAAAVDDPATSPPPSSKSGDPAPAQSSLANPAAAPAPGELILSASGYVTPRQRIALSPRVMGRVIWVGIEKGDRVEKGQVLVRLDDDEYRAQAREAEARFAGAKARLAELEAGSRPEDVARARATVREAEASLANANLTLVRRRDLQIANVEAQQLLDDATMQRDMSEARLEAARQELARWEAGARVEAIEAARADLAAAQASLEYAAIQVENCVIRAPIDGTILEKLIEPGELVSPQSFGGTRGARTELVSIADLGALQVELDINEADFAKVSMSQPGRIILDAYPGRAYSGRIREIAPEANRTKATVQIKVEILDPDHLVLPEMSARVDLLGAAAAESPAPKP